MAENIVSRIRALHRVDVGFVKSSSVVNSLVGREAHINFLDTIAYMLMIGYRFPNLFP